MTAPQLIPPPDLAPPSIADLSPIDRARLWARMVDEGDRIVLESFRQRCGTDAGARQAFQEWLDRRDAEATAAKVRMLAGRRPTERSHGG